MRGVVSFFGRLEEEKQYWKVLSGRNVSRQAEEGLARLGRCGDRECVSHQIIRYRDWLQKVIGRECVSCRMAVPGWLEKVWGRGGVSRQAFVG